MCGCTTEAFALAQRHNKIRQYGEILDRSDNAQPAHYLGVAQYFENEKYTLLAGKYYYLAKEYQRVTNAFFLKNKRGSCHFMLLIIYCFTGT